VIEIFQQSEAVHLREVWIGLGIATPAVTSIATCSYAMVVSSGEWSGPISQLMAVAWCCSTRLTSASMRCSAGGFMRAQACEKRDASSSMPFMRMMRTRVYASSSSLLIGFCTMSRQVSRCFSSAVPFSCRMPFIRYLSFYVERMRWCPPRRRLAVGSAAVRGSRSRQD